MIVTLEIPAQTLEAISRFDRKAEKTKAALSAALHTALAIGAEEIRSRLVMGELGLTMQNPGSGLAAALQGWMLDESLPLGALGVPANTPASAYAAIQEFGGTIRPVRAGALAVPISKEAKGATSPRDMDGLTLIRRNGRPPLLVRVLAARGARRANWQIHWVLLPQVTIQATHWLSNGVEQAAPAMAEAFGSRLFEIIEAA